MALFKRTPKDQTIAELEQYYAQYGNRSGRAWLMAFGSLLVTVVVLVGLFFGGRWLYRAVNDDNTEVATTQTEPDAQNPVIAEEPTQSAANDEEAGMVSNEAARTDESNADRVTQSQNANTSRALPSSGTLPQTGPNPALVMIVPIVFGILGYLYSVRAQRR